MNHVSNIDFDVAELRKMFFQFLEKNYKNLDNVIFC